MKKLYSMLLVIASGFYSCNRIAENSTVVRPIDQLQDYVENRDGFRFSVVDSLEYLEAKVYRTKMISGKWLNEDLTIPSTWWHWVDIIVPNTRDTDKALLFIGGGTSSDSIWQLDTLNIEKAIYSKSVIAHINNIPFQPIRFGSKDTIDHYEDDLIAYGWKQFLMNGAGDEQAEWLARFPMTRAVSRAMDVVQEITLKNDIPVQEFFISGASKRGWTTWTTAAIDKRVIGMAPLVIDLLNLKPSFDHHYRVYGDWSPAVQDYINYGIMDWIGSKEFDRLLEYVEPYQFKERFEMPKLIINGTVDEFFVTDSWKFYYHDLTGYKQLQYVPNGNHSLAGSYNTSNVFSFFDALVHNEPLPQWQWKVVSNRFEVFIEDDSKHYEIALWSSTNPKARDFRIWEVGQNWVKTIIPKNENGVYSIQAPENKDGYTSSLIEVTFKRNPESPLVFTTGTIVLPETYPFEPYQSLIPMGTR